MTASGVSPGVVGRRGSRLFAHAMNQIAEIGISGKVGANHDRVEEEADNVRVFLGAKRSDLTDSDVVLIRVAMEHRDEGSQHRGR
jgi:hypothetical protein